MAAFATVIDGFAPQLYMSELIDAMNERGTAAEASGGYSFTPLAATGVGSFQGSASVFPMHRIIQDRLESLAVRFVDHTQEGYDDEDDAAPIAFFTLASWRAAAGLHEDGFRRAASWDDPSAPPSFSHGKIATGDIAGYWIWQDIVKGLKALRWTGGLAGNLSGTSNEVLMYDFDPWDEYASLSAAIAGGDTIWQGLEWAASGSGFARASSFRVNTDTHMGATIYMPTGSAARCKGLFFFDDEAPVDYDADFLIRPTSAGANYYDLEGLTKNEWVKLETVAGTAADEDATTTGYTMATPSSTPFDDAITAADTTYPSTSGKAIILKWKFSRE